MLSTIVTNIAPYSSSVSCPEACDNTLVVHCLCLDALSDFGYELDRKFYGFHIHRISLRKTNLVATMEGKYPRHFAAKIAPCRRKTIHSPADLTMRGGAQLGGPNANGISGKDLNFPAVIPGRVAGDEGEPRKAVPRAHTGQ
jgi:hypothetical protein